MEVNQNVKLKMAHAGVPAVELPHVETPVVLLIIVVAQEDLEAKPTMVVALYMIMMGMAETLAVVEDK
jgi:hypothetical protein